MDLLITIAISAFICLVLGRNYLNKRKRNAAVSGKADANCNCSSCPYAVGGNTTCKGV